jgi:hypothetical protein
MKIEHAYKFVSPGTDVSGLLFKMEKDYNLWARKRALETTEKDKDHVCIVELFLYRDLQILKFIDLPKEIEEDPRST